MIEVNQTEKYTEIYIEGGENTFITESFPTNFHTFLTRKILTNTEKPEDYKEVTAQLRKKIEESDAKWTKPPQSFIDKWTSACKSFGKWNESTGYFELNGIKDIAYTEALIILNAYRSTTGFENEQLYYNFKARTLIPRDDYGPVRRSYICRGSSIIYARLSSTLTYTIFGDSLNSLMFSAGGSLPCNLVKWLDNVEIFGNTAIKLPIECLKFAPKLTYFRIANVFMNVDLRNSLLIGIDSLKYLVNNRYVSTPIIPFSVIVHPDVYAKLVGDFIDFDLTEEELAAWLKLMEDAVESQISFVTV